MTYQLINFLIFLSLFISFWQSDSLAKELENPYQLISCTSGNLSPTRDSPLEEIWERSLDINSPTLSTNDLAKLVDWINSKKDLIHLIDRVIYGGSINLPLLEFNSQEIPKFRDFRNIHRTKLIQSRIYLQKKDYKKSISALTDSLKFAQMVSSDKNAMMLHYMMGSVLEGISTEWIHSNIWLSSLNNSTLNKFLETIQKPPFNDKSLGNSLSNELYKYVIPNIDYMEEYIEKVYTELSIDTLSIYDKNESKLLYEKFLNRAIENTKLTWSDRDKNIVDDANAMIGYTEKELEKYYDLAFDYMFLDKTEFHTSNAEHVKYWKELAILGNNKKNILGRINILSTMETANSMHERSTIVSSKFSMLRTSIAIKIYHNIHSDYPANLQVLVNEGILRSIPLDPFSNLPLHYSYENKSIWSVGLDGQDNNGNTRQDIVFSCIAQKLN